MEGAILFVTFYSILVSKVVYANSVDVLLDELISTMGKSSYHDQHNEPYGYGESNYGYNAPQSYEPLSYGYEGGIQDLGYGKQQQGYAQPMHLSYSPPVQSYSPPSYQQSYEPPIQSYQPPMQSYQTPIQSYEPPMQSYQPPMQSYQPPMQSYAPPVHHGYSPPMQKGYGYQEKKPKKEKIYVPIVVKKKKKKKMKIITVQKGFYIAGGTQLFGKYKSLKSCQKACAATPTCFSGDYNPWLKKCYIHSNFTACGTLKAHKKLVHFKKVPCDFPEAPEGRVILGVQIGGGIEQKGIKSLSDCVKRCANTGVGIPATSNTMLLVQKCFGIDYDFGTHKCFFHVNNAYPLGLFCPLDGTTPEIPRDAIPNPAVVTILLCPGAFVP